jgi:uncharacterized protein (DUF1330 family)
MGENMRAYLVATVRVDDPDTYKSYTARTPDIIAKHGGRFLVRGGPVETLEGPAFHERLVIVEFPSMEAARSFYDSPDYRQAMAFRVASADSVFLLAQGVPEGQGAPDDRVVKTTSGSADHRDG